MVPSRRGLRWIALVVALALTAAIWPSPALARERLKVLVPEKDNLQYLAFWVARASGAFERQGIDLEVLIAPSASTTGTPPVDSMLEKGEADAAVLTPTLYLRMIGAKAPIVLVANLFANEPYALVVRRESFEARTLSASAPIKERVTGLKGATIGYPPAAFGRLRALLAAEGLDLGKDIKGSVLLARAQNEAFNGAGRSETLDAALLATPALEKVVVAGGVVLVNLARGDVPELATRQTHVLASSRRAWDARRDAMRAAVRAIAEAERLIHTAQAEVVDALVREQPSRDRRELETLVALYEPAVPATPDVHAEHIAPALALVPDGLPKPDLAGVDLAPFVAADAAAAASGSGATPSAGASTRWIAIALGALALVAIVLFLRRRRA